MTTVPNVYVTFYGYDDNDDGNGHFGTAVIAYPQFLHKIATEDEGTFTKPSTFAASTKYFAPGEIIYVPRVGKYYIQEDECVEANADATKGKIRCDLYIGGNTALQGKTLIACEDKLTADPYTDTVIRNPPPDLPVWPGPLFDGVCHVPIMSTLKVTPPVVTPSGPVPPSIPSLPPSTPSIPAPSTNVSAFPSGICDLTDAVLQTVVAGKFATISNLAGYADKYFSSAGSFISCEIWGTDPHSANSHYPRCELKCKSPLSTLFRCDFCVFTLPDHTPLTCFTQIKTASQEIQFLCTSGKLYCRDLNAKHFDLGAYTLGSWFNLKVEITPAAVLVYIDSTLKLHLPETKLVGNWKCGNYMQSNYASDTCIVGLKNLFFK
jgi:hypothetical protein